MQNAPPTSHLRASQAPKNVSLSPLPLPTHGHSSQLPPSLQAEELDERFKAAAAKYERMSGKLERDLADMEGFRMVCHPGGPPHRQLLWQCPWVSHICSACPSPKMTASLSITAIGAAIPSSVFMAMACFSTLEDVPQASTRCRG